MESKELKPIGHFLEEKVASLESFLNGTSKFISRIPTGYNSVDSEIFGWQLGNLVIVGSRPGMGKSALLLNMAFNITSQYRIPIGFFSLEANATKICDKLFGMTCDIGCMNIASFCINTLQLDTIKIKEMEINKLPFYLNDAGNSSADEICIAIRNAVAAHGIKVIMIDYLQLVCEEVKSHNRESEIAKIVRKFKNLARDLQIVIILASQLSRAVETRGGDKRPLLSDLRESGSIEQDADQVIFLYRPEYYGIDQDEEGNSLSGKAELIFAKNRSGPLVSVPLLFESQSVLFKEWEEKPKNPPLFTSIRPDEFI